MTARQRFYFWAITTVLFFAALITLKDVLAPFVAGMGIAYFLDPLADRLEKVMPRWLAAIILIVLSILLLFGFLLLLLPLLAAQIEAAAEVASSMATRLETSLAPFLDELGLKIGDKGESLPSLIGAHATSVLSWGLGLLRRLVTSGVALANIVSLVVITPIVAFYLLRDWDRMVRLIDDYLPQRDAQNIREQAIKIDETLSGFVRGQASVCLSLGCFYAIALSVVGLKFGLIIGIVAGLISFIPFVGTIVGAFLSIGFALMQYDTWGPVGLVVGIFVIGQLIEGNYLTPKLVGDQVGLHPVWVIFALMAGGTLFGFVGVLLAVPVAAVIGVVTRFSLDQYKDSNLYTQGLSALGRKPNGVPGRQNDG